MTTTKATILIIAICLLLMLAASLIFTTWEASEITIYNKNIVSKVTLSTTYLKNDISGTTGNNMTWILDDQLGKDREKIKVITYKNIYGMTTTTIEGIIK